MGYDMMKAHSEKSCILTPPKKTIKILLLEHFFAMGPCLSHRKTCWFMSMHLLCLEICILRTSTSMVTQAFFFLGVNRSGPQDEFNIQLALLHHLGTTSWSIV